MAESSFRKLAEDQSNVGQQQNNRDLNQIDEAIKNY